MFFKKKLIIILMLMVMLIPSACQSSNENNVKPKGDFFITIATGGTTGPYFAVANGLARLFDQKVENVITSVRSTGGGVENIQLLLNEKSELAFVMADIASFAYEGKQGLGELGNGKELRAVTALYPNFIQIITLDKTGIRTIRDMHGKRIGVGAVGSGTEVNTRTILQSYGLSYADIDEHYLSYKESVIELRNGNIDAAFLTSGLPNAMILELTKTDNVQFIPISEEKINKISKAFPYYSYNIIPKGTYNNEEPISTAAITNLLVTREDLPDELIYNLTKVIFENIEDIRQSHHAAGEIDLEKSQNGLTVPLHPGAKRYFEEHR